MLLARAGSGTTCARWTGASARLSARWTPRGWGSPRSSCSQPTTGPSRHKLPRLGLCRRTLNATGQSRLMLSPRSERFKSSPWTAARGKRPAIRPKAMRSPRRPWRRASHPSARRSSLRRSCRRSARAWRWERRCTASCRRSARGSCAKRAPRQRRWRRAAQRRLGGAAPVSARCVRGWAQQRCGVGLGREGTVLFFSGLLGCEELSGATRRSRRRSVSTQIYPNSRFQHSARFRMDSR